ncbi:MAG: hypothetical protein PVH93_08580, partial [Nitrosopumilaceae archaeon]
MKSLFILFGLIAVIAGFYLAYPEDFQSMQFNQVFAQSENKKFEEATTAQSSDTSTYAKSNNNKSQADLIGSQSNGTATEKGKIDNEAPYGKSLQHPKIHPAVTNILDNANPMAMAKIYGAQMDDDQLFVYVHLKDKNHAPTDIETFSQY